jgi:hypothetical protein
VHILPLGLDVHVRCLSDTHPWGTRPSQGTLLAVLLATTSNPEREGDQPSTPTSFIALSGHRALYSKTRGKPSPFISF